MARFARSGARRAGDVRADEAAVEAKRIEIRDGMRRLGDRIASGDDSELLYWVVEGALACAHRSLRYHPRYAGSRVRLPAESLALVNEWTVRIRAAGIRSILSLMHDRDLVCYGGLDLHARTSSATSAAKALPWRTIRTRIRRISIPHRLNAGRLC